MAALQVYNGVQAIRTGQFGAFAAGLAISAAFGGFSPLNYGNIFMQVGIGALRGAALGAISGGVASVISGGSFGAGLAQGAIGGAIGGATSAFFTSQQYQNLAGGKGFVNDATVKARAVQQMVQAGDLQGAADRVREETVRPGQAGNNDPKNVPLPLVMLATAASALDGPLPVADAIAWALVAAATVDMAKRIQFSQPVLGVPGPHTGAPLGPGEFRPGPSNTPPWLKWGAGAGLVAEAMHRANEFYKNTRDAVGSDE